MKRKLWYFISLLVLAITAIFVIPSVKNLDFSVNAEEETVEVSIKALNVENGFGYPDDVGIVNFRIELSKIQKKEVKVYYCTNILTEKNKIVNIYSRKCLTSADKI